MSGPHHDPVLELHDLTLRYGSLTAVNRVTFSVRSGARHALIGPNGAGKSSLFSVVAGSTPATSGRVVFNGHDVSHLGEIGRAKAGLVRTFQHSKLFLGMSVLDNARLSVERAGGRPGRPWPSRRADRAVTEDAMEQLASVGLADRHAAVCGALSHGERRQLEVAMVLACRPRLVLFDEPTAGMSVAETHRFAQLVESLPSQVTVLVVEHDLDVVFRLAQRVSVLAAGQLIAEGTTGEIRADERVRAAYLSRSRSSGPLFGAAP